MPWRFNIQDLQIRHKLIISPCNQTKWERNVVSTWKHWFSLKVQKQEKAIRSIEPLLAVSNWGALRQLSKRSDFTVPPVFVPTFILLASSTQQRNASSKKKKKKYIIKTTPKKSDGRRAGEVEKKKSPNLEVTYIYIFIFSHCAPLHLFGVFDNKIPISFVPLPHKTGRSQKNHTKMSPNNEADS